MNTTRSTDDCTAVSYKRLALAGRCANGNEGGHGRRVHAVTGETALCGATYGQRSAGWGWREYEAITCPRCLRRCAKAGKPRKKRKQLPSVSEVIAAADLPPPDTPPFVPLAWWDAVRKAPTLPVGCISEFGPSRRPFQPDLFPRPAMHVLEAGEARALRLTPTVRLVALTLARMGEPVVPVDFRGQTEVCTRLMFDGPHLGMQRLRHALEVLLARGFLRIEQYDDGEPVDCTLTIT